MHAAGVQDNKHTIREKRHIVTANSNDALINFDTFSLSFSPLHSPLSPVFNSPGVLLLSLSTVAPIFPLPPHPRCFHLHPSDRSLCCSPAVDEEKSRRSLRARRRENTSALYIFLDRPGHNSGDESVLLGPHRTHTLANPPSYLRSRFSFPTLPLGCRFVRRLRLHGAIRVEERRVTL